MLRDWPSLNRCSAHPGLVYDKFVDGWEIDAEGRCSMPKPGRDRRQRDERVGKQGFFERFLAFWGGPPSGRRQGERQEGAAPDGWRWQPAAQRVLKAYLKRQEALIGALGGEVRCAATDWRFVSGLGNAHPFEAGLVWHPILGVPYLPGSSVKGLIRAWAYYWKDGGEHQRKQVERLFGDAKELGAGRLIVFDALPLEPPELELDVVNPHYAEYYRDRSQHPADYLSPVPSFFLAVAPGQEFRFALAPRPRPMAEERAERDASMASSDLQEGWNLLEEAVQPLAPAARRLSAMVSSVSSVSVEHSG